MFCRNCGTQLDDVAVFCNKCGTKIVSAQAPVQQSVNPQPQNYQQPVVQPVVPNVGKLKKFKMPIIIGCCVFFLVVIFLLVNGISQENYTSVDDFKTEIIDNDSIAISDYIGTSSVVRIPPRIQNRNVWGIDRGAFCEKQLTSITIPDTVVMIVAEAFESNRLTNITIPNSVKFIGDEAFASNQLTSVIIPDNVEIDSAAFAGNQITNINIGSNVSMIGEDYYSFDNGFDVFYINNGNRRGSYTYKNGRWNYQEKN
jgi:hypothetical protein